MEESKSHIENLYFRSFRAIDDRSACMKFIEGHTHVLEVFGITQITSAKIDWVINPDVYVILVTGDDGRALAGGRVHRANRKNALPIEDAVGFMDERIYDMVEERTDAGTGELAGLWNSWEIAGLGIGSMQLGTACVAYSDMLGLSTLFGLCAPATYRNTMRGGFRVIKEIGNSGKFYYPKDDMTATSLLVDDIRNLPITLEPERSIAMNMRANPISKQEILSKTGETITLHFDLTRK